MSKKIKLFKNNPHRYDIIILLVLSVVLFVIGITQPVVTFEKLIVKKNTFSIISGILALYKQNHVFLGVVVTLFSICFPLVKYIAMIIIWFGKFTEKRSRKFLRTLKLLGRWSMLDFFVTLIAVGSMQLGILAKATIRHGIYFFGAAIFLSIVVSFLIGHLIPEPKEKVKRFIQHLKKEWTIPVVAVAGLIVFGIALFLPLMSLEKWEFWKSGYSLLSGSFSFISGGQSLLGYTILIFVILLPVLQFLSIIFLYLFLLFGWKGHKILKVFLFFDDWSMIDVFALSLLVFLLKSSSGIKVSIHTGFWLLMVTAVVSIYISIRMTVISIRKSES